MKKRILAITLICTMILSLAACTGKAPAEPKPEVETETAGILENAMEKTTEEVELNVWYAVSGITGETFEAQIQAYQQANPNVKINLSYAGSYADAAEKVSANLLTGTPPDIALMAAGPLYTGARGDFTIEELIEDPTFDKDDIYDGVWDYAKYQGRICAIPYGISLPVLYYNKTILEAAGIDIEKEAPSTWEELYALAERAQKNGNVNQADAFYGFEVDDAPWLFKSMLNQVGNSIIETEGGITPVYNDEKAAEVAAFWQKLTANGIMPVGEHGNAQKTFLAGNCAFIVASSIRLARWSVDPPVDFGVLPMPTFGERSLALGGNVLVTFAKDEAKLSASWDLLKYLTNAQNHTDFSLTTGYLPIHKSAMEMDAVKAALAEDPRRETVYNEMQYAWSYWHFDEMGVMDTVLMDVITNLEKGMDVQSALDEGVEDLENEM